MLGANGLTLAAADAVNGLFGIREAGCPLLADGVLIAEHPELIADAEIVRNVHAHGAGHTVAAAGAADFDVAAQDVGSLPDGGVLGVGHGAEISEGGEVVVQLVFCTHAGEDDLHIFVAGHPAQRPRGCTGVCVQCIQRRGSVRRQLCQRTALDGLHDDEGNIQFFGKSIAPVACDLLGTVVGVEVVVLQLAEVPRLVAQDMLEARRVVVAGEAKIPDAPGSLLLPEPVHNAHLFGRIVAGFVQGMQQIEVDVVHAQPLELLLEDVFGLVEGLAAPHRQLGGEVEALPRPLGNDPAHERFALTAVVGESGVKVVDTRLSGSVQQLFGPYFVDAAIRQGGEAHTPVAQQRGGDVPPAAVFFRPITILHSHFSGGGPPAAPLP